MRIIAGQFRSRPLLAPRGFTTRPMPDRVRESLFGMLGARIEGAHVADLFAGSGAIGLEALSRGAASCVFVEQDRNAADVLQRNIDAFKVGAQARIVQGDALGSSIPARLPKPVDLIMLDPPYPLVKQPAGWNRVRDQATRLAGLLAGDGFLVLRTPWPFVLDAAEAESPPPGDAAPARKGRGRGGPRGRGKARTSGNPLDRRGRRREHNAEGEAIEWIQRIDRPDLDPAEVLRPDQLRGLKRQSVRPPADDAHDAAEESEDFSAEDGLRDDGDEVRVKNKPAVTPGTPGDLSIAGLRGPETHVYGTTAVHWYMQKTP